MVGKLTTEQMEEVLRNNSIGRIGCSNNKQNYIVPIHYTYDGKYIFAHSYEGLKITMMRENPLVCFEVDEMKDFNNWKSVIIQGNYVELTEERERLNAIKFFNDKTVHIKISETAITPEIAINRNRPISNSAKTIIYKIIIQEMTGRFESRSHSTV